MGVACGVPGVEGREARWRRRGLACCCKLCVNQKCTVLPPTRERSWPFRLGVDAPPGCRDGRFPSPGSGSSRGSRSWCCFCFVFLFTFPVYILKTELAVRKGWRAFHSNFPERLVLSVWWGWLSAISPQRKQYTTV